MKKNDTHVRLICKFHLQKKIMAVSDDGDTNRPDFAITYRTWKKYVQTQLFNRKNVVNFS